MKNETNQKLIYKILEASNYINNINRNKSNYIITSKEFYKNFSLQELNIIEDNILSKLKIKKKT